MNIEIWQFIVYFLSVFIVLVFGILIYLPMAGSDDVDLYFVCFCSFMPLANTTIATGVIVFVLIKLLTHATQNDRT